MGTIIKDFFNQNMYSNEFDQLLIDQILYDVDGKEVLSVYYAVEGLFTEIASGLIDYVKDHKELVYKDKNADTLKEEIDTLNLVINRLSELNKSSANNKYNNLINIFKNSRDGRANSINRNYKLSIKAGRLIDSYNQLNTLIDKLYNNNQAIEIKDSLISPLRLNLEVKLINRDTEDYYMSELNNTIREELAYLNIVFEYTQLLSAPNVDYDDLSNLEAILENMSKVKEVLGIKREILRDMYYKLINTNAYNHRANLNSIIQEISLLESATDYLEYMLHGNVKEGSKYEYPINRRFVSDETGRDINNRLNNIFLSHISPIRVIK